MSTTTVSVRSTTHSASIEDVRRREAETRRAAQREQERQRKEAKALEAVHRRLVTVNRNISEQEALFQQAVSRLDKARHLPDLALQVPSLPGLMAGTEGDPDKLEDYAARLVAVVQQFSRQLDAAIVEAERLLERRIRKASAWRSASDLEQQAASHIKISLAAAVQLGVLATFAPMPDKPLAEADVEVVEAYVVALRLALESIDCQYASLVARVEARERAATLGGPQMKTRSALEAHDRHETERAAAARAKFKAVADAALASAGMRMENLSESTRFLIDDAVARAKSDRGDRLEQIARWIALEKQRRDGVSRALVLMQSAPDMVHDDLALSRRWSSLVANLQRVAGGLDDFTSHLDHEYEQLCADACRNRNRAYSKADWLHSMSEQGFDILEREDGGGLVVVDLDHPEIWLDVIELESGQQGGFGAVLELKTDGESSVVDETAVTADICTKLSRVAGATAPEVQTQTEVIEHNEQITRGRRPARVRRAFAQGAYDGMTIASRKGA